MTIIYQLQLLVQLLYMLLSACGTVGFGRSNWSHLGLAELITDFIQLLTGHHKNHRISQADASQTTQATGQLK